MSLDKAEHAKACKSQAGMSASGVGGLKPKGLGDCSGPKRAGPVGEENLPLIKGHCLCSPGWWLR